MKLEVQCLIGITDSASSVELHEGFFICIRIPAFVSYIGILKLVIFCWTMTWTQRYQILDWLEDLKDTKLDLTQRMWLELSKNHKPLNFNCVSDISPYQLICQILYSGYIPPEYAVHGIFSTKSDVFSFGVLVLEIVSGMKNREFSSQEHGDNLLGHVSLINLMFLVSCYYYWLLCVIIDCICLWFITYDDDITQAWRLYKDDKSLDLVSGSLRESCIILEVLRSIHIGLLCVQNQPEDRPTMSSVVLMLGNDGVLPQPKPPAFFTEPDLHLLAPTTQQYSAVNITTSLTGR